MGQTFRNLSPMAIVEAFASGNDLWQSFGAATIRTLVQDVLTLAGIWQSAWEEGGGDTIPAAKLAAVAESDLVALYSEPTFLPSLTLDQLIAASGPAPPHPATGPGMEPRARRVPKKR